MTYEFHLYRFRPSNREKLIEAANAHPELVFADIVQYVKTWEEADWLDSHDIEIRGRWIAKYLPQLKNPLLAWAMENTPAKAALIKGLVS